MERERIERRELLEKERERKRDTFGHSSAFFFCTTHQRGRKKMMRKGRRETKLESEREREREEQVNR